MPAQIGRDQVQRLVAEGAQLVEVLPALAFRNEHLPGAINIPLKEMTRASTAQLDRGHPIVVYCFDLQCDLSARAAWVLAAFGFTQVYDYAAGKQDWFAHDLPMEGEEAGAPRAGDKVERDVPTCAITESVGVVRERVEATGWHACVVMDEQDVVLGLLERSALESDPDRFVEDVMEHGPSTSRPHEPLAELREYFQKEDASVAVISTSDGILIGLLRREDAR
jgi:rhodanese-related sulfurtransferase/CBS domain-containing protein